ncbi:MAG TPA: nucleotidyltransferase family protein [Phycisphaerae bacterium]|nr:nucleotidyltransferase family protein [Phycisphaerae bacterium]
MVAIPLPLAEIQQFCRRHFIRRLALFGSVTRPDFRSDSDIDVLVEFTPGHAPGLDLIDIQDELSTLMGQPKIDLVTEKFLSPRIRNAVRDQALVIYEE